MLELQPLFAAPGAANNPEAVEYLTIDDQVFIAYASGPGIVICKDNFALQITLAFDDAFPVRSSTGSPASVAGLAVDNTSNVGVIVAWRNKQIALWTAHKSAASSQPLIWKPSSTLSIQEDIACLSFHRNCIILGTSRTIECWTTNLKADIPIWDCVWTRDSNGPCKNISLAADLSHLAWSTEGGSEAYVQRLTAELLQDGIPQVLKHSKRLHTLLWRRAYPGDSEPCLVTQTVDSSVRLYTPVLDDPFWFQLVAAIDLKAAIRRASVSATRGKAPESPVGNDPLPFVMDTFQRGESKKGDEKRAEEGVTFISWIGPDQRVYGAQVKGLDKRPPQLVQVKMGQAYNPDPKIQDGSTQPKPIPGALRYTSSSPGEAASGLLLAVPPRTPGINAAYKGLIQYTINILPVSPSTGVVIPSFDGAALQGFQPRAKLVSAGPDGSLLFESQMARDRVLEIALRKGHTGDRCSGNEGSAWCLEEPDVANEKPSDRGLKSMKVFERVGIRLAGSASGLRLDRKLPGKAWREAFTLDRSESWESWEAVYPYQLSGMGETVGSFEMIVIALARDSWGLDGHAWRITVDLERTPSEPTIVPRQTVTLPDPGQHEHHPRTKGHHLDKREWSNVSMSHKESTSVKADLLADGSWRVPCAFALTDGDGEVVLLDLAGNPGQKPECHFMEHCHIPPSNLGHLKVYPQGLVLNINGVKREVSLWRPSSSTRTKPEFQMTCSVNNADLLTTTEGYVLLAIGNITRIRIFGQERVDPRKRESRGWRELARLDLSKHSPYPNTGLSWLPSGDMAVTAGRQLLIAGLARPSTEKPAVRLVDIVNFCNAPLPQMHPTNLEATLMWDHARVDELLPEEDFPLGSKSDDTSQDSVRGRRRLIERGKSSDFYDGLTGEDRSASKAICELLTQIDEFGSSVDRAGMRFLVSLHGSARGQHVTRSITNWDSVVWAARSKTQEALVKYVTTNSKDQRILWHDARRTGVFLWIYDNEKARALAEDIARNQFLAGDRDPIACSLLYFALGKKSTVHGLWRQISGHAEQNAMIKFLINDFTLPRWKSAAAKNAYALLGKQRYEYAAAFFVLAGNTKDAVNICVKQLQDWQLGLAIARLMDPGSSHELLKDVTERIVLPLAISEGSRWLLHWSLVTLDKKEEGLAAILEDPIVTAEALGLPIPVESIRSHNADPALLALLADLKHEKGMKVFAQKALADGKEMAFVLECVKAYWRMGCRTLALDVMRGWQFESPPSRETLESPKINGLSNGAITKPSAFTDFEDFTPSPVVKMRSEKAGVMAVGEMKDSKSSQGGQDFDMGAFGF